MPSYHDLKSVICGEHDSQVSVSLYLSIEYLIHLALVGIDVSLLNI